MFAKNISNKRILFELLKLGQRSALCSKSNQYSNETLKERISGVQAVCFDVGSTVIKEEGIDILADFKGVGPKVSALTIDAMSGKVPFREALSARLNLIKPSVTDLKTCLKSNPFTLTTGIEKLISRLQSRGVHVYLVSGGFRQLIDPVALQLRIPLYRVYANNLIFDGTGNYLGFDAEEYTCREGGKAHVINHLKKAHGYSSVAMVGDSVTDMEACPPADFFIGYGGVSVREAVKNNSDWYISNFEELL